MSSTNRDRQKIVTSLMLVIMFLFADLALPQAIPEWSNEELQDENLILRTTTTFNATQDSGIQQNDFNSSQGVELEKLGFDVTVGDSRLLFSFNNSVHRPETWLLVQHYS